MLASGRGVHGDVKRRIEGDVQRNRLVEHLFEERLLETLVDAVEGNATHLGINQIRTVAHDNFQPSMLVCILPPRNQMLHV